MMRPTTCMALMAMSLGNLASCDDAPTSAPAETTATEATVAQVAEAEVPSHPDVVDPHNVSESDSSRDPFRSYQHLFPPMPPPALPDGKAARYELEQLELTGIMMGEERRVILTDPDGYGWIVGVGERVASWRVDEIRENHVVFTHEDFDDPQLPIVTRSKALHVGAPRHARG